MFDDLKMILNQTFKYSLAMSGQKGDLPGNLIYLLGK